MLSWADLEALKQNSGHHPLEKKKVNNHHHQMVHPVVDDAHRNVDVLKQAAGSPSFSGYQTKCVGSLVF